MMTIESSGTGSQVVALIVLFPHLKQIEIDKMTKLTLSRKFDDLFSVTSKVHRPKFTSTTFEYWAQQQAPKPYPEASPTIYTALLFKPLMGISSGVSNAVNSTKACKSMTKRGTLCTN